MSVGGICCVSQASQIRGKRAVEPVHDNKAACRKRSRQRVMALRPSEARVSALPFAFRQPYPNCNLPIGSCSKKKIEKGPNALMVWLLPSARSRLFGWALLHRRIGAWSMAAAIGL
jgi:hypothetical protein